MSDDEQREERRSDVPVDLTHEREVFVRQFFRRGVELTEGLLEENKQLQERLTAAHTEIARLRSQIASDDAIRDFMRTIETLETERRSLLERSTELEQAKGQTEHRNLEVEQELHDLANLYIASSHLHSTLSVRGVMRHLGELLQQLVGAEAWVIYLRDQPGGAAHPVSFDGFEADALAPLEPGEGVLGDLLITGIARVADVLTTPGSLDDPKAAIPLMARDEAVGVIAITSVFEQKEVWEAVDHELFKLLGSHAALALIAAKLYAARDGAFDALSGLLDHLRPNH
ncbi:MAG: GAF domain-containing protein [Sandaracinaceae bacterium]